MSEEKDSLEYTVWRSKFEPLTERDIPRKAWLAACEYKNQEIELKINENKNQNRIMNNYVDKTVELQTINATMSKLNTHLKSEIERLEGWNETTLECISHVEEENRLFLLKNKKLLEAVEFYADHLPRQFHDGYYEINFKEGEGGHVLFGAKARQALKEIEDMK